MRNVLFVLAELSDSEVDWLVSAGTKTRIRKGDVLVRQGEPSPSLFLVLTGEFLVTVGDTGKVVAKIERGELIGEISFLDSRPPTATVIAGEDASVLAISRTRLRSKLRTDTGFASRFYLALGIMLAHRLRDIRMRDTAKEKNPGGDGSERNLDPNVEQAGEFSPELLDKVDSAARRFNNLLDKVGAV